MRVIMTGGGTGGHIYPAIAIADKIMERTNDSEILFVGTRRGMESRLVPENGYEIRYITVSGLNRKNMIKNIKVLRDYRKGKAQAKAIIEEFKPDIVIGTGGYVSGPVVRTAAAMGIRCFLQEQNAVAGVANRMLERHVEKIFLGFEEGGRSFKQKDKLVVSGNPVRSDFFTADPAAAREKLGIAPDKFVVLSFGGSLGAGRINKAMVDVVKAYNGREDIEVFFGTGKSYYAPIMTELRESIGEPAENIHVLEYINNMQDVLAACDLVISRSGALTVSEITLCGKPSILIPSPNVTGDHQTFNARAVSDKGGAILLEEKDLTDGALLEEIEHLRSNPAFMQGMADQAKRCAPLDATDIIFYTITDRG
ncbi:MAG: undecaprenyldiphospho-muramoylpentapeptide beta-N-acetylglucosaminyltransferase [Clostridiales bacterium]|nr:undecaprenyldiphospho-muramoylpentapeptide beta-N-acetylglucosaminyltransferase [Clostridiales bacterium]